MYSEFDKDKVYDANGNSEGDHFDNTLSTNGGGVFIDFLARETYSENIMLKVFILLLVHSVLHSLFCILQVIV